MPKEESKDESNPNAHNPGDGEESDALMRFKVLDGVPPFRELGSIRLGKDRRVWEPALSVRVLDGNGGLETEDGWGRFLVHHFHVHVRDWGHFSQFPSQLKQSHNFIL